MVDLLCYDVTIDPSDLHVVFAGSAFPALKVLIVYGLVDSSTPSAGTLTINLSAWGNQLLSLSMNWYDTSNICDTLLSLPHLLVDWWLEIAVEPAFDALPAHLRLTFSELAVNSTNAASALPAALKALAAVLRSLPSTAACRLKVLILPRPFRTLPDGHRHVESVKSLLEECAKHAVEVLCF